MMQPYQNFQTPQFQGPMYPQQQIQHPYMDRLAQLQAMQQNLQPQPQQFVGLNGRVVDSTESIVASDVPMDGTFAVFPKRDMSEISVKYWTGEGKIATMIFKPFTDASVISEKKEGLGSEDLNSILDGIYAKIDNLSNKFEEVLKTKSTPRSGGKKEASADE